MNYLKIKIKLHLILLFSFLFMPYFSLIFNVQYTNFSDLNGLDPLKSVSEKSENLRSSQDIKLDTYAFGEGLNLSADNGYTMKISGFVQPYAEVKHL